MRVKAKKGKQVCPICGKRHAEDSTVIVLRCPACAAPYFLAQSKAAASVVMCGMCFGFFDPTGKSGAMLFARTPEKAPRAMILAEC
jgi:hypothetical protein